MIKDIIELNFPKKDGKQYATLSQATVTLQDMAEKTITTQVRIDGQITPDFSYDWAVSFKGNKYIFPFRIPPGSIDDTSILLTVDLTFQHWAVYELKRQYFFSVPNLKAGTAVPDKYIAPVSLNLTDFCKLFAMVLTYYYDNKITVDLYEEWKSAPAPVMVEISYTKVWDVLIRLYELYGVRWQIEPNGDIDHYVIKVGYPTTEVSHVFEHGFKGGLLKFEQQVQDDTVRNMIYGRGGNKNLPYRYFKKHDEDNQTFSPDPDWIPELKDIYFTELRGATFRSYIQGWKAKHIAEYRSEYPDEEWVVTTPAAEQAYAPWAWQKGYTDTKFDPVEFVKDDESISRYGELPDALDNNEEIFPTIQGIEFEGLGRIDETVKIEEIKSDEVEPEKDNDAVVITPAVCKDTVYNVPPSSNQEFTIQSAGNFLVSDGKHGDLEVSVKALSATRTDDKYIDVSTSAEVVAGSQTVTVVNADTGEEHSATGIPPGKWYYRVKARVRNLTDSYNLNITVGDFSPKLTESTINATVKNAWHIWVKNIWQSSKLSTETDIQYAERIWRPILGDLEGSEAKVIFTDGMLAMSQDYEFPIVAIPTYDPNENLPVKDEDGNIIGYYPSHWCIPLGKSDADLEDTGTYVPSTMRFAEAGNHIAFIGIDMPHLYVVEAEKRLDNWKKDNLDKVKDIAPSVVIKLDPVRIHNYGKADALVDSLVPGNSIRVADKRFILNQDGTPASFETLYLQSVTYTYNEPTETEANLLPDVEVVLSDKYEVVANPVERLTGEVTELHKQIGSISNVSQIVRAVGDKRYLRKDIYDRASAPIDFMQGFDSYKHSILRDGVQFGASFAEGVTGFGGKIDRYGEAWLGGLHLRSFLEVPEFRYNRTEISIGNAWNAPGGGIIERVSPDYNADGSLANTGTITLHLEDGEIGAVAIGDLCSGIFHDEQNLSNNSSADSDDGQGNFRFAGFCTVYFTPTEILEKNRNSAFRYELRPVSAQWTQRFHPSAQMHFVGYGNNAKNTDGSWKYPERQKSRYSTRTYERYLVNVNNWEFGPGNIAAQFGDLSNLSIQGINMSGYSAYMNNIYMTGHIEQLDLSLRMEVDYGNDNFMAYGETRTVKCRVFRGWQEVTDSDNIEWSVARDTGNAEEDAAWNSKLKVAAFKGEIAIRYSDAENDLGSTPETGAIFTFTAKVDGETASAKLTLRRNPQDGADGTTGRNYTHNLLLGSEFPVTRRWRPAQNVEIDNTHTLEGRNSIRSSQSDLSASAWRGITQDYAGTIQAGDVFTASAWCYCENLGGIDNGVRLEIQVFAGNERVATGATSLEPSKAGEWQQAKTTVTVPEGATRMAVTLYVNRNGTVWFSSPKLERGENAAPEWTANPADRIATPTELYYLSASDTELAGGSWGTAKPVQTPGHYLWTRTERLYGDGTVELTEPVCVTGEKGEAGTSVTVTSTLVAYQAGTSGTVPPTGLWSLSIPKVPEGQYLWTRTTVAYSDGNSTETYTVSRQGADGTGVTVTSTEVRYAVGNYPAQPADNLFTLTSPGTLTKGQWLWTRTTVTYSDGTPSKSYTAAYIGADGTNGLPGAAGTDGRTSYVHFAYASGITGSLPHPTSVTGFSTTTFVGAKYLGICTDFNAADPTTNVGTTYEWSEYRGADGKDGNSYTDNLLRNSDFADGFSYWLNNGCTTDAGEKLGGRNSVKCSYSGLTENKYYGMGYYMDYDEAGTDMTFSVAVLVKDLSTLPAGEWGPVSIELRCLDAYGNRLPGNSTFAAAAVPTTAGVWQRFRVSGKTLEGTKRVSVHFMLRRNGTVWFNSPKLEFGDNPAPVWTPYAKGNAGAGFTPNMLPGTRDWDGWTPNGSWASGGSFEGLDVMHGDAAGITTSHIDIAKTGFLDLEADTVYTLSMWAKGIGSFQSFVYPDVNAKTLYIDGATSESRASDTFAQHTLTSEWKRYYVVFRTLAGNALTGKSVVPVRIFKGDNEVWIAGVKLEKGENHATQWSPTQDEMVGEDAYSVMLTNESHVFEGDTDRAVMASVECGVRAYRGITAVPATIGTVSGMPSGMSVATVNNGSTSAKISIGVNSMLTTKQGTLKIPVMVDGLVFEKTFSWALALKGGKGDKGPQGIQGCIYRVTQWAAGFDYHNDSAQTGNGIRYIDVVLIPNPALATKAYAYICKEGHTSTAENAPGVNADTSGNNTWWEKLNSMAPIYTPFLLADGARISLLQSNQILVMKEEDASIVNVGFGGGKIPLWIGATEPTEADFHVDATGKAYMTGAEISGHVTAGDPDGQRVALLPDDKTMKIYDEKGHEASSFEGNTYSNPLNLFGSTSGGITMKQRTGTDYGYGSGVTYGRGTHTLTGNGLGTNTEYENLIISGVIPSDAPVEVIVSGYLYTEYKEQATLPSYPSGTVTPVASGDTPVTDITPTDPGGTVPLYNSTASLTLYIDTYSDALLTTRVGSQEIARCRKKGDGVLISQKRVKTTTGGYHVLRLAISMTATGNGVTATVKWGKAVSVQQPDISGTYTSDFYMSRYFANGFCLGISKNNYISAYDQGDKKGMRFVMENAGYGIDVSNAGIRHRHHGGNWVSMPLFVMKARYGYTNGSYIRYDSKSFNGSYPSLSHKGQGWVRLTYPPEWSTLGTLSAANLIVHVTGYGASAEDGKSPLKATVTVITSEYIDITLSDDESPNDGGFLIDISLLE